jgi:hypothetical protein
MKNRNEKQVTLKRALMTGGGKKKEVKKMNKVNVFSVQE